MALLDTVKTQLRISASDYDDEVNELISAAEADMSLSGILKIDEMDDLIKRAVTLYCKGNFGYDNPDRDRLLASYESLKNHLSLSTDYSYYTVTINAGEQMEVEFDGMAKETNDSGLAVFYSKPKNHVPYVIGGATYYADITADVTLTG